MMIVDLELFFGQAGFDARPSGLQPIGAIERTNLEGGRFEFGTL